MRTKTQYIKTSNVVLKEKFTDINAYIKKQERSPINYQTLKLKSLEKNQTKPKAGSREEILNIKAEINKTENRKTMDKINKIQFVLSKKINKIDNS